ncbi:MAG: cupin domain-containing protein [Theionarchaea archaeon]|nr:cupin domain-containing protein [Theionarchaea archaeon]
MEGIHLEDKFNLITQYWNPKIIAELNGQYVKLAKVKGEFVWHSHEKEDELFFVMKGHLEIRIPGRVIDLKDGDLVIIPRGIPHKPAAREETHIMLFEPVKTKHTGDVKDERTVENQEWI